MLVSEATLAVPDAQGLADRVIEHLIGHGVTFKNVDGAMVADVTYGSGSLRVEGDAIKLRIEAIDQGQLENIRAVIASHVIEFAGEPAPSLRWVGYEPSGQPFANFREVRLIRAVNLTPHMRRLTFTGDDIGLFASDDDIHVRMFFPPEGVTRPEWPRTGADGRIIWPEPKPAVRYYTIRRIDLAAAEIDVDFVLHDAGPGSRFAEVAKPGTLCGMVGPLGRNAVFAPWMLLAGDETALPAIARILETVPADTEGHAFIEIANRGEEMQLKHPLGVSVTWLHRNGGAASASDLLPAAVKAVSWPDHTDIFAWAACEATPLKAIRDHLRVDRKLDREKYLAVGYWTREESQLASSRR